jgi:tRNA1(Val) A37 N6-methylase TrmN6
VDKTTKKRLGQYFSGHKVAELLASFCTLSGSETVIDPMAGTGDMLEAAIRLGIHASNIYGIEIDEKAAIVCKERLPYGKILVGDSFSLNPWERFGMDCWDVVITNPPYVRYQTMSGNSTNGAELKNASEIRGSLSRIIETLHHLSAEEKACFQGIIKDYSGLSDLAVPSWLLCAALVKRGGTLAMVVPESWINRDYALSIKYLLLKFFDIRFIVEDLNATWFDNAQVKTNLVVARRTPIHGAPLSRRGEGYSHLRFGAGLIGKTSLVDNLEYAGRKGLSAVGALAISSSDVIGDGFEIRHVGISDFISEMSATQAFVKAMRKFEPDGAAATTTSLPRDVRDAIGLGCALAETASLADWNFCVGQGLRTGANRFFYAKFAGSGATYDYLKTDSALGNEIVKVSREYSIPVLRYQTDAKGCYRVSKDMVAHRLLYIRESFFDGNGVLLNERDKPLAQHIAFAESLSIESGGKTTRFSELSAVKPNARTTTVDGQTVSRHWFMLPALAKRHLPQLCVSRVNHKSPRCLMIEKGVAVDANFATLWTDDADGNKAYAMFALLNSSWVKAYLECVASVMGGGALKVEAAHLRQLQLPKPAPNLVSSLANLGKQLTQADIQNDVSILHSINELTLSSVLGVPDSSEYMGGLRELILGKLNARQK